MLSIHFSFSFNIQHNLFLIWKMSCKACILYKYVQFAFLYSFLVLKFYSWIVLKKRTSKDDVKDVKDGHEYLHTVYGVRFREIPLYTIVYYIRCKGVERENRFWTKISENNRETQQNETHKTNFTEYQGWI